MEMSMLLLSFLIREVQAIVNILVSQQIKITIENNGLPSRYSNPNWKKKKKKGNSSHHLLLQKMVSLKLLQKCFATYWLTSHS